MHATNDGFAIAEILESRRLLSVGPTATLRIVPHSPDHKTGSVQLFVTYDANTGVDPTSLDDHDIRVAGPNGFGRYARAITSTSNATGTERVVQYKIAPPSSMVWNFTDNGRYTVRLHGGEVFDMTGRANPGQFLGAFHVAINGAVPGPGGAGVARAISNIFSSSIISSRPLLLDELSSTV